MKRNGIYLIVDEFYYLLADRDRFKERGMFRMMNGLIQVTKPSVISFFVFESKSDFVFVWFFEEYFEIEIGLLHEPA